MSRRAIRQRLDRLELRALQMRQPEVVADPDLPDYAAMSDEELAAAYAEGLAAHEDTPEERAYTAWLETLSDDELVQVFRDGLNGIEREPPRCRA